MAKTSRLIQSVSLQATSYSPTFVDNVVEYNAASANLTPVMPNASTMPGKAITLKKVDATANTVAISFFGSQVADLYRTSITLRQPGDFVTLQSDGSNWQIVGKKETEGYQVASAQTPLGTNGAYLSASNNSITLTPGVWRVSGTLMFFNGGVVAGIYGISGFYGANGAGNSSTPIAVANATVISGFTNFNNALNGGGDLILNGPASNVDLMSGTLECTYAVTANTTVFVVPGSYNPSAGSGFVRMSMWATRVW